MRTDTDTIIPMVADVVSAYIANNRVAASELSALIRNVHDALARLGEASAAPEPETQQPAVSIRASIKPDYLICLEDGKKLKMLKRYLMTKYQMTPADYRAKWNLPAEYPMVAPNYSAKRSELAVSLGLGQKKTKLLIEEGVLESSAGDVEIVSGSESVSAEPSVKRPIGVKAKRKVGRPAKTLKAAAEAPEADAAAAVDATEPVTQTTADMPVEVAATPKRRPKLKAKHEGDVD